MIKLSKEDVQEQTRLVLSSLPLDDRRFNLEQMAQTIAQCLERLSDNRAKEEMKTPAQIEGKNWTK